MNDHYFQEQGRLSCGQVHLVWGPTDRTISRERQQYQGSVHGSLDSVFAARLREIGSLLSERTITTEQSLALLLPAIAAYGIELSAGPITINVTAEAVEEEEGLVPAHYPV